MTWLDLYDHAIVEVGLMPDVFWRMTWGDYIRVVKQKEHAIEQQYRHTRLIMAAIVGKRPESLFRLPGDMIEYDWEEAKEMVDKMIEAWQ